MKHTAGSCIRKLYCTYWSIQLRQLKSRNMAKISKSCVALYISTHLPRAQYSNFKFHFTLLTYPTDYCNVVVVLLYTVLYLRGSGYIVNGRPLMVNC